MVDIHHEGTAHAPLHVAFGYIDDYRTTPDWMFGIAKFEPVGELDHGKGAVFEGTFQVKPVKLQSVVECTDWEATGDEVTKVSVDFTYELPGGLAGRALGKALEPIVGMSIKHSDANLRKQIEQRWAKEKGKA
jgi:hypothetical protein